MISKRALKRYIDSRIRAYLDDDQPELPVEMFHQVLNRVFKSMSSKLGGNPIPSSS